MSKRLEELGAEVARMQDEALADGRRRAAVRRRLSSQRTDRPAPAGAPRWGPALAWTVAMAAIALAVVMSWPITPQSIAYRVDDGAESRLVDRSIDAPPDRRTSIAFTDGSEARLAPSSRVRVRRLTADGASLTLDRGEAAITVHHRETTRWSVHAGPFLVRVTGTRFRVGWQPDDEIFDLVVLEGEVRVTAPDEPERTLRGGDEVHRTLAAKPETEPAPLEEPLLEPIRERKKEAAKSAPTRAPRPAEPVRASSKETSYRPPSASRGSYRPPSPPLELKLPPKDPSDAASRPEDLSERQPDNQEQPEPSPEPSTREERAAEPAPAWKALLDDGQYRKLLTELGADQVEQALWQAEPSQLIDLGAAARELRDGRAGYIYSVTRSRFPGTDAAADAAFVLGRMQFHSGAHRGSATWFETYLRERPDGRFTREAAGRLVEAYHRSGDEDRARDAAERYLARYPNGPHADLARSVLE